MPGFYRAFFFYDTCCFRPIKRPPDRGGLDDLPDEAVAQQVEKGGIEAWQTVKSEDLIGAVGEFSATHYEKIKDTLDVLDYWEPLINRGSDEFILDPDEFYILVSRESVHVPPAYAAEMVPFNPLVGEFRVHYAGFFDPGFGHSAAGGTGSRAVLEVRSREVPFLLGHGQTIGRLVFERLTAEPDTLYGGNGDDVLDGGESPTDALLTDWPLLLTVVGWVAACVWALWGI